MIEKRTTIEELCMAIVWLCVGLYFVVQPVFHNLSITGMIWRIGLVALMVITVQKMGTMDKRDFVCFIGLAVIVLFNAVLSGILFNGNKVFSIIAFFNLLLLIMNVDKIKITNNQINWIVKLNIALAMLFFLYTFTPIVHKVTTAGRIWNTSYFVFNLDNSNTAAMYLYGIYCVLLVRLLTMKRRRFPLLILMAVMLWMIFRTYARTCIAAVLLVTVYAFLFNHKKVPKWLSVPILILPFAFVFIYLGLYSSGFTNITFGQKTLFSGRQETFMDYLSYVKGWGQILFGNIGEITFTNAHNAPLSIFCSTGAVGCILYFSIVFRRIRYGYALLENPVQRIAFVSILGVFIQASTEASLFLGGFPGVPYIFIFFILLSNPVTAGMSVYSIRSEE